MIGMMNFKTEERKKFANNLVKVNKEIDKLMDEYKKPFETLRIECAKKALTGTDAQLEQAKLDLRLSFLNFCNHIFTKIF